MKANFRVMEKEVTVYFTVTERGTAECYYCGKDGAEIRHVQVTGVESDGVRIEPRYNLYRAAEIRTRELMFAGRAVHIGKCENRWVRDHMSHKDASIG